MQRTRLRPMPDGRVATRDAWVFGSLLTLGGLVILALGANLLSAGVALATMASYAVVYTPLKRYSSFSTVIGAIPGALPPVIGWAAALDELSQGAWVLFGIVFLWQLPHFLAIAWIYREDYAAPASRCCRSSSPTAAARRARRSIYALALLPLSLAPTLVGMAGPIYFARRAGAEPRSSSALALRFARPAASPTRDACSSDRSSTCRSSGC